MEVGQNQINSGGALSVRLDNGVVYQLEPLQHALMKVIYGAEDFGTRKKKVARSVVAGKVGEPGWKDGKVPESRLHTPTGLSMCSSRPSSLPNWLALHLGLLPVPVCHDQHVQQRSLDERFLVITDEGNGTVNPFLWPHPTFPQNEPQLALSLQVRRLSLASEQLSSIHPEGGDRVRDTWLVASPDVTFPAGSVTAVKIAGHGRWSTAIANIHLKAHETCYSYARAMRCPRMVLASARARQCTCGTDIAYGAAESLVKGPQNEVSWPICLRICYAISGTHLAYGGARAAVVCCDRRPAGYRPTRLLCDVHY
eukprot:1379767-Rhodomonas_salina.1